jgi:acetylornithine deacetylase/succinyl-diaminopimelate desuccinylase-like protein
MDDSEAVRAMAFSPTCNVQGLWSGFIGPGAKTITPAEAHVRLDIRLVPDQYPSVILGNVRKHLDRRGFTDVETQPGAEMERAYWTTPDDPLLDAAARVSEEVFGQPAKRRLSVPGTAPMWQVCGRDRVRMTSLGGGHDDCRAHAPDENYRLDFAAKAAQVTARFLDEFAAIGEPPKAQASAGAQGTREAST